MSRSKPICLSRAARSGIEPKRCFTPWVFRAAAIFRRCLPNIPFPVKASCNRFFPGYRSIEPQKSAQKTDLQRKQSSFLWWSVFLITCKFLCKLLVQFYLATAPSRIYSRSAGRLGPKQRNRTSGSSQYREKSRHSAGIKNESPCEILSRRSPHSSHPFPFIM